MRTLQKRANPKLVLRKMVYYGCVACAACGAWHGSRSLAVHYCSLFFQVVASYQRLDRQLLEARADGGADAAALAAVEASLDKTLSLVVELEGFVKRVLNVA